MRQRLTMLEKAMEQQAGHHCPLCKGEPWAEVFVVYGSKDRAFAIPPERYLAEDCIDRVTDDLRCRRCGTRVAKNRMVVLVLNKGTNWPLPSGRAGRLLPASQPPIEGALKASSAPPRQPRGPWRRPPLV